MRISNANILICSLDPAILEVVDTGSAWENITYSTTARTLSDSAAMIFASLSYTESARVVHQWLISQKSYWWDPALRRVRWLIRWSGNQRVYYKPDIHDLFLIYSRFTAKDVCISRLTEYTSFTIHETVVYQITIYRAQKIQNTASRKYSFLSSAEPAERRDFLNAVENSARAERAPRIFYCFNFYHLVRLNAEFYLYLSHSSDFSSKTSSSWIWLFESF